MKFVVSGCIAVLMLSACSQGAAPGVPSEQPARERALYGDVASQGAVRVIYSFDGRATGARPMSRLLLLDRTLYGTTAAGGANDAGSVFALSQAGRARALYSFPKAIPGHYSQAGELTAIHGVLYGALPNSAGNANGAIYSVDPSTGTGTILYTFKGAPDGAVPVGGLTALNGVLYGTTVTGGASSACRGGCGTVFTLNPSTGQERVIYSFQGVSPKQSRGDGSAPTASLTVVNGAFYGTTSLGGIAPGKGTVFEVSATGKEAVLHRFNGGHTDGFVPSSGALVFLNGDLYGTTTLGGSVGEGTIYKLDLSGNETVMHSFPVDANDGMYPDGGLLAFKNNLYGTTTNGGAVEGSPGRQSGTIFELNRTTNVEVVLNSFDRSQGRAPVAGLTLVDGMLYGTTQKSGPKNGGTVFTVQP